jgi:hypothetical protein
MVVGCGLSTRGHWYGPVIGDKFRKVGSITVEEISKIMENNLSYKNDENN